MVGGLGFPYILHDRIVLFRVAKPDAVSQLNCVCDSVFLSNSDSMDIRLIFHVLHREPRWTILAAPIFVIFRKLHSFAM